MTATQVAARKISRLSIHDSRHHSGCRREALKRNQATVTAKIALIMDAPGDMDADRAESKHKLQVLGQRLKGPGMQWSEAGAVAMAALVAHRLNGTGDRFWASRPLQRAA